MYSSEIRDVQESIIQQGDAIRYNGYYIGPELGTLVEPDDEEFCLYTLGGDYLHGRFSTVDEAKRHADELDEML